MRTLCSFAVLAAVFAAGIPRAVGGVDNAPASSPEFQRLKALVGTWKATADLGQGPAEVTLQYRLVAGGSALEERLFADTPKEMVTMYHDQKGRLTLTHYCMMGNQPRMRLISADDRTLRFDFDKACGINPRTERHMHALNVPFLDADAFQQDWTCYENGKPADKTVTLAFKRVKP